MNNPYAQNKCPVEETVIFLYLYTRKIIVMSLLTKNKLSYKSTRIDALRLTLVFFLLFFRPTELDWEKGYSKV